MTHDPDGDFQRVATACQALDETGAYPGVRSVQRYLKEQLGGGMKTERIGELIRRWESQVRPGREVVEALDEAAAAERIALPPWCSESRMVGQRLAALPDPAADEECGGGRRQSRTRRFLSRVP